MVAPHYRTVRVRDLDVFNREAGDRAQPTIVLLHGMPTSSFMFVTGGTPYPRTKVGVSPHPDHTA